MSNRDRIKKWLTAALMTAALFIPLAIALISYAVINSLPEPVAAELYTAEVTLPNGSSVEADLEFCEMLLTMKRDADAVAERSSYDGFYRFDAEFLFNGVRENCSFWFSRSGEGYMIAQGKTYSLKKSQVESFLTSKYAASMFENSSLPLLTTASGRTVLPTSASWYYTANGTLVNADVETRETMATYEHNGSIGLAFSTEPDSCEITITDGDGNAYSLGAVDESRTLEYTVRAVWNDEECYGSAYYHFFAMLSDPAEFSVSAVTEEGVSDGVISIKLGDFIVIAAKNVSTPGDVRFSCTPSIDYTPSFYSNGSLVYALIPFGVRLADTAAFGAGAETREFEITVSYGENSRTFKVGVSRGEDKTSLKDLTAVAREYTQDRIREYNEIREQVCATDEAIVYTDGIFRNLEVSGTREINLGFRYIIAPTEGEAVFVTDGVLYSAAADAPVPAVGGGKVVAKGSCGLLGNYVVVDHGLGLKTWYCQLSGSDIRLDETVAAGQTIGRAGTSGVTSACGVRLITTVGGVPVSPYAMLEQGFPLLEISG